MKRFLFNSRGNVDQRIVVIAIIVVVALFSFVKIKAAVKCTTLQTDKNIWAVLFDDETKEACQQQIDSESEANGGTGTPTGGSSSGSGSETGGGSGSGGSSGSGSSGSGGSGTGGSSNDETGSDSISPSEEAVPISHYEQQGIDLTCSEKKSFYAFSIPTSAPPQSIGTQSILLKNNQGWDMWVKIYSVTPENGLLITTDDNFYRKMADGEEVVFRVGWKWNVLSGYTGEKGAAKVYFEVSCKAPATETLYQPDVSAPTNFRVTGKGDSKIDLTWDKVNYASEYYLYRNGNLVYKGSQTNYSDANLLSGTTYSYKLYTAETTGTNNYASLSDTTTGTSPIPAKPANLRVPALTEKTFYVGWNPVPGATSYRLYLDGKYMGSTVWSAWLYSSVTAGSTHTFEVAAENTYGVSAISSITFTMNSPTSVANPMNFIQESRTTNSQVVSWDPVPGATSYVLTSSGTTIYSGTNTTFSHTGLGSGGSTHYFLYAVKGSTKSSGVQKSFATLGYYTPTIPYNIQVTNITNTSMKLTWSKGSGATTTKIKMNGTEIYNDAGTTATITGLTPNTHYKIDFQSINFVGTPSTLTTSVSTFTTNETYDDVSNLSATCSVENYVQKLTFPSGIRPGESGMFILNASNTSNRNLYLQIESVERNGSLFEGSTPVKVEFDEGTIEIKPTQKFEIPIRWILPSNASSNYTGASGSVDVHVKASC